MNWNFEKIHEKALKYEARSHFRKFDNQAYQAAKKRKILDKVCSHMSPLLTYWTLEMLQIEANKHMSRIDFFRKSNVAYQIAHERGILEIVCSHMRPPPISWTPEKIKIEALKYPTRRQFQKNCGSAYNSAHNKGIMDEVSSHMEPPMTNWTLELIQAEALKYKTRGEFHENDPNAYGAAQKRGILDQICSHMKRAANTSGPEKELMDAIRIIYPRAKKLKDMSVNIIGKSYIHGFDIDILVDKMGIEFDGKYHHSFEYMRKDKGKRFWSDDDIRNYHKLKDDWFATKGIQILHIKEEDWKKNKEECIARCLIFLSGK